MLTYLLVCILLYPEQMLAQLGSQGYLWFNARFLFIDRANLGHLWYLIAIVMFVCIFAGWEFIASKLSPRVRQLADICILILVFSLAVLFQASGNYYNFLNNPINNYVLTFPYAFLKRVFLEAFPFFAVGMLMCKYKTIVDSISIKNSKIILFIAITVSFIEYIIIRTFHWEASPWVTSLPLYPIVALFLFALKNPTVLSSDPRHGKFCRKMSSFIYYFHVAIIFLIPYISIFDGCSKADVFLLASIGSFIIGCILYKINNKYLNFFFN